MSEPGAPAGTVASEPGIGSFEAERGDAAPSAAPDASRRVSSERAAAWVFGIYVAAALPLLLFKLGSYFWFFRDDWYFITSRELSSIDDLFRPHNGHWSTVPIVVFRVLYALFGIRTYLPYEAVVVVAHLGVVVLIRVIMRRVGVGPWLATAAAGAAVLFGSGREDILWAFQMGYTGSLFFILAQWLLADHDGPIDRRDGFAVACGLVALMSASPPIPTLVVMTLALLVRRGWKATALQIGPLAVIYVTWNRITHPEVSSPYGRPTRKLVFDWVRNGQTSTFLGLGRYQVVAALLAVVLVVGVVLALLRPPETIAPGPDARDHAREDAAGSSVLRLVERARAQVRPIATPLALFGGTLVFMVLSAQARWLAGPQAARASRYVYIYAVLTLPLLAVAAQAIASRWRLALPVLAALFLVGIPANIAVFDDPPFGPAYHDHQEAVLRNAVRTPYSRHVPSGLRPVPDVFNSPGLTIGFLLGALDTGKLDPPAGPMAQGVSDELAVRLGLEQAALPGFAPCRKLTGPLHLRPSKGQVFAIQGDISVRLRRADGSTTQPVVLRGGDGPEVTVERDGMDLQIDGAAGTPLGMCQLK